MRLSHSIARLQRAAITSTGATGSATAATPAAQAAAAATPTTAGMSTAATQPVAASAQPSTGGQIQADPATNSLIITAPEPQYRQLRAVIDRLDSRRAQVFVESLIVEVNADKAAEFGIQWQGPTNTSGGTVGVLGTNPFLTHGACRVDVVTGSFGGNAALQASDFQAAATVTAAGALSAPAANGDLSSATLDPAGAAAINRTGLTQFRIAFELEDNGNGVIDRMRFGSAENATAANRPELVVTFVE